MKPGGGKGKGSAFERRVCQQLSLWVTDGERKDCFWRSAMSGGRATVIKKKGESNRQAGDITAVAPEGHRLTNHFYIECKHYKQLNLGEFFVKGTGKLAKFWEHTCQEAKKHGRMPVLIAQQNMYPAIVITRPGVMEIHTRLWYSRPKRCEVGLLDIVVKGDVWLSNA